MHTWIKSLSVTLLLLAPIACSGSDDNDDKNTDPDPNPDPSVWLVGDNGTMVQLNTAGEASGYPLELDEDLLAIACHGQRTAWVVGDAGTVLHSRDAGASWDTIEIDADHELGAAGLEIDWRALAVAEHTPEGAEVLWLVGEDGAIAHTPDGGASWLTVPGASVDFTGVATQPDGNAAIAVADDGSIWALQDDGASLIHQAQVSLWGVSMAAHGGSAIAVGDGGTMLRRVPQGVDNVWEPIASTTDRDLFAVRMASDGALALAVGEAGVVVRINIEQVEQVEQVELLDEDLALHAIHLGADGRGQAVGDAGTVLLSTDAGSSWSTLTLATTTTLRGIDDFHANGHL